uniref:Uncharacterized protein n=1 Tax=Pyramimonas obovata TaxID=1411642 RepID=A0A7S0MTJ7_9CHLO|mmetsp:Transcript_13161/g.27895  ORF Transcript_13161/g.27895 Transcript_13161/m.27895 type:complete len:602 (+) Transcript_13161:176-1981(+)
MVLPSIPGSINLNDLSKGLNDWYNVPAPLRTAIEVLVLHSQHQSDKLETLERTKRDPTRYEPDSSTETPDIRYHGAQSALGKKPPGVEEKMAQLEALARDTAERWEGLEERVACAEAALERVSSEVEKKAERLTLANVVRKKADVAQAWQTVPLGKRPRGDGIHHHSGRPPPASRPAHSATGSGQLVPTNRSTLYRQVNRYSPLANDCSEVNIPDDITEGMEVDDEEVDDEGVDDHRGAPVSSVSEQSDRDAMPVLGPSSLPSGAYGPAQPLRASANSTVGLQAWSSTTSPPLALVGPLTAGGGHATVERAAADAHAPSLRSRHLDVVSVSQVGGPGAGDDGFVEYPAWRAALLTVPKKDLLRYYELDKEGLACALVGERQKSGKGGINDMLLELVARSSEATTSVAGAHVRKGAPRHFAMLKIKSKPPSFSDFGSVAVNRRLETLDPQHQTTYPTAWARLECGHHRTKSERPFLQCSAVVVVGWSWAELRSSADHINVIITAPHDGQEELPLLDRLVRPCRHKALCAPLNSGRAAMARKVTGKLPQAADGKTLNGDVNSHCYQQKLVNGMLGGVGAQDAPLGRDTARKQRPNLAKTDGKF